MFKIGDRVEYDGGRWGCIGRITRVSEDGLRFRVQAGEDGTGASYRATATELRKL